uniref:Pyrin domain-containing protein n=1 Tax=Chelonoidis abingdonii TaxID=106734 RepID=A0A8C0G0M3_CHEAB
MAITSSKINDLLLCALDELSQENFKRFKDKLSFIDFDGGGNIPQGPLENADRIDTKNLLVKFYGEDTVLDAAIEVFTQINLRASAVKLKEEKRKGKYISFLCLDSGGYTQPPPSTPQLELGCCRGFFNSCLYC